MRLSGIGMCSEIKQNYSSIATLSKFIEAKDIRDTLGFIRGRSLYWRINISWVSYLFLPFRNAVEN